MGPFAHSVPGRPEAEWELLRDHLREVSQTCADFASAFGFSEIGRVAGLLHDIGKCSAEFAAYIGGSGNDARRGPNHSTAGAFEAVRLYGAPFGTMLAFVIAGHHAGLADGNDLERRLEKQPPRYEKWETETGLLPEPANLAPTHRFRSSKFRGFTSAFLTRMLFSCLVDADRLETAAFYAAAEGHPPSPTKYTPLPVLRDRLAISMAAIAHAARGAPTPTQERLARLRADVLSAAIDKSALPPGFFTLTVPTGGGKTLASLSFALNHAVRHDLSRIVYVIPFTSIIEQTAGVFRSALGPTPDRPSDDVLEHHATFDWEAALNASRDDGRGVEPVERLQRATENWDAPVVVTTAVQFFESLFAARTSACRKLHNLAHSVIVLDEAQTLPLHVLRPCLAALDELVRNYGATIVLCTATQPAWREIDGKLVDREKKKSFGLDIPADREIAPDPSALFTELRRVTVDRLGPTGDDVIVSRFAEREQMLCIVNTRRHAKALFERIRDLPGAIHLSTWMCPRHRRLVLEKARADLAAARAVRIVSTSLIEAGVDIDLPEVWRAAAGLDSILQAAGRCNREFRQDAGRLVIFEPLDVMPPHDLKQAWEAGRAALRRNADPQTLEAITDYFGELYLNKGMKAFDACRRGENRDVWRILPEIAERADKCLFPFASIAEAFRIIEDTMAPVIVPWSSGPGDDEARSLLRKIGAMDRPLRDDLRKLQQYTVSIPRNQRDAWLAGGALRAVHPALGDAMLCFDDDALYDPRSGLRVDEPEHRAPESNIF